MNRIPVLSSALLSLCWTGCDAPPKTSEPATNESPADIAVQEEPGAAIRGELSGGDGRLQSGCTVRLVVGFESIETRTDANGAFRFSGLPPGEASVSAETLNGITLEQDITLVERETAQVRLAPPGDLVLLHGHARAFGEPLSSAQLFANLHFEMDTGVTAKSTAMIDGNGTYELLLPGPGNYSLSVTAGTTSRFFWSTEIDVAGVDTPAFDIDIMPRRISGRVTDAHGVGLASISVYLEPEAHPIGVPYVGGAIAQTDADGRYELMVSPGPHRIWADRSRIEWSRDCARTFIDVTVGAEEDLRNVDLAFAANGALEGVVHASPSEVVQIWQEGDVTPTSLGWTDEHGRFEFPEVTPGRLFVGARGSASATREPLLVELPPGARQHLELVLAPARTVYLTFHEKGRSVGAFVAVRDEHGNRQPVHYHQKGGAWVGPLVPGRYTVHAENIVLKPEDQRWLEQPLDVEAGEGPLEVHLQFE